MRRRLFTVEDTFEIPGRCLVLLPRLHIEEGECFQRGDPLELRRPDGTIVHTVIGDIEMLMGTPPPCEPVIALKQLLKSDVPIGTEIWSVK